MSDDNDNVISFNGRKTIETPKIEPFNYEFHFHSTGDVDEDGDTVPGEVVKAHGFLKFGPQFIAVVDRDADISTVLFAVATPMVKYVKKLDAEDSIQATLSL